ALRYLPRCTDRMGLYCGRRHPPFDAGTAAPGELRQHDYVGLAFHSPNMEATHRFGLRRRASVTDQEGVATLVLSGCYIGFLPDHYAAAFVQQGVMRKVDVAECRYDVQFVAMLRRSPTPGRVAQA